MRRFFGHILKQPKAVRNNYAMAMAGTFTGVVALVWLVTKVGSGVAVPMEAAENTPGGFATLFKETKEQVATVQQAFKEKMASNATTSEAVPTLEDVVASSTEEAISAYNATATAATSSYTSSHIAVPVLIGTTTATTSITATGTATSTP
jgi:flagellar hook-length control protein FliK